VSWPATSLPVQLAARQETEAFSADSVSLESRKA
jgi:hypothetical protein